MEACREAGGVSIINDRVDVAIAADADGVHVGQVGINTAQPSWSPVGYTPSAQSDQMCMQPARAR